MSLMKIHRFHVSTRHLLSSLIALTVLSGGLLAGPVTEHGRLHVQGRRIIGTDAQPVSLAGVSFGWSQWESAPFYNAAVVNWLCKDWNAGIVRAALGIDPAGYLGHPEVEKARVGAVIDAAIAADIYVIIDWHDYNANEHTDLAVAFFKEMAGKYGNRPNIIYEIFNEPIKGLTWKGDVKPYADKVIAAIRSVDTQNLIVVGTPTWSQDVDVAAEDRIKGENIAYTLHFYAGTHKQWLREKAVKAMNQGLPLFVTEWGSVNSDGNGAVDAVSTNEWMLFMREWQLSNCVFGISDKNEATSIVLPGASKSGGWDEKNLTASGRLARDWVRTGEPKFPTYAVEN